MGSTEPTGLVTYLFTDIEGSTRLWDRHPEQMAVALEIHDELLREIIETNGGHIFSTAGDSFAAAFQTVSAAVTAALETQLGISQTAWPTPGALRVRMGLHTGEAIERGGDYFGTAVIKAARIMSAAHGGQTLASSTTGALVTTPGVVVTDAEVLELRGLDEGVAVCQLSTGELDSSFPPLRAAARRTNLVGERHPLIGRVQELDTLVDLVRRHRLVSVVGPGGVGKTFISAAAARRALGRYSDGVWMVELAGVGNGGDIAPVVAATVGLENSDGTAASVAHAAARMDALILLDNCEHVLDSVADFAECFLDGDHGTLLTTSQARLDVPSERLLRLEPLDCREATSDGVQLFLARAAELDPGVEALDEVELGLVRDICSRLDGFPLGIELAASRIATLSLTEIDSGLHDRFRLLRRRRSGSARHRSLLAAVEWTYELLDPQVKAVFDRLSVFRSAFDRTDAQAVCASIDALDVAEALDQLVDTCLVDRTTNDSFRLAETMRALGHRHLNDSDTLTDADERHIALVLKWVSEIAVGLTGPDERSSWASLQEHLPDIRAGIDRAVRHGDAATATKLVAPFVELTFNTSMAEVSQWASEVLSIRDVSLEPLYPSIVTAAAYGAVRSADSAALAGWLDLAPTVDPVDDLLIWTAIENARAARDIVGADFLSASRRYETIAAEAERHGDSRLAAFYLGSQAFQVHTAGDHDAAESFAQRALAHAIEVNHASSQAWAHFQLGLATTRRDPLAAAIQLENCLALVDRAVPARYFDSASANLAVLLATSGDTDRVADLCLSAMEGSFRAAAGIWFWPILTRAGQVLRVIGDIDDSLRLAGAIDASDHPNSPMVDAWIQRTTAAAHQNHGSTEIASLLGEWTSLSERELIDEVHRCVRIGTSK